MDRALLTIKEEILDKNLEENKRRNLLLILSGRFGRDILYFTGRKLGKIFQGKQECGGLKGIMKTLREYFKSQVIILKESNGFAILVRDTPSHIEKNIGLKTCYFEAGFISGVFSRELGLDVFVRERKCKSEGYDYCEFEVVPIKNAFFL